MVKSLILLACHRIVKIMFDDKVSNAISKFSLSYDTIQRRINDLSVNIEKNVNNSFINTFIALKIDKSTDITEKVQ